MRWKLAVERIWGRTLRIHTCGRERKEADGESWAAVKLQPVASASSTGSSEAGWPFRCVLGWSEGTFLYSSCWPVIGAGTLGRRYDLGKKGLFGWGNPLGSWQLRAPRSWEVHLVSESSLGGSSQYWPQESAAYLICLPGDVRPIYLKNNVSKTKIFMPTLKSSHGFSPHLSVTLKWVSHRLA